MQLDKETNDLLRSKYNPQGSKLRQLQLRELEILLYIDKFCKKNNIKYWLSGGSCLGAVRHNGFIPWDDDIDIEMLDKDYRRFERLMLSESENNNYIFHCRKSDPNYFLSFGKVRDLCSIIHESKGFDKYYRYKGCFVDVFPVAPSNSIKLYAIWLRIGSKIQNATFNRHRISFIFWKTISKLSTPLLMLLSSIGAGNHYRYRIGVPFSNKLNLNDFSETIDVKFENLILPIPKNYHSYLTQMYGNYMSIPSDTEIQTHTNNFELW